MKKIENKYDLLEMVAGSMNSSIAYWKNVDEAIEQDITISRTLDTNSYITQYEYVKLNQKSWIGK